MLRRATISTSMIVSVYVGLWAANPASAALVTLEGADVYFIYDTANVDPAYGTLTVNGNQILALPTGFRAESIGGVGSHTGQAQDSFNATGTIQIKAKPGFQLDGINIKEVGSYSMTPGNTSVGVGASLRVFDWNDFVFGPQEFSSLSVTPLNRRTGTNQSWSGTAGFNLATSAWDSINHVGLQLDETLTATSYAPGEHAWIQKTAAGGAIEVSVFTSIIPIPAAVWLMGSGLLALVGFGTKRRQQGGV